MSTPKLSSKIWDFFTINAVDETKANCDICNKKLQRGGRNARSFGTSALINHLRSFHHFEYEEYSSSTESNKRKRDNEDLQRKPSKQARAVNNLSKSDKKRLEALIGGGRKTFHLLYSAERDGCNAAVFHNKCNNQGPTLTVLYNGYKTIFGGYTAMSWQNGANYVHDSAAFLFQLCYNGEMNPQKFNIKLPANAIYNHSSYGPTFGSGHDLCTFNGIIAPDGQAFKLNGGMTLNTAYDMKDFDFNTFANSTMEVIDIEVYSVLDDISSDLRRAKFIEKPWRTTIEWSEEVMHILKGEIESYMPISDVVGPEVRFPSVNILFIGPVGAGKSSFFNTVNSVFRGKVFNQARSGRALNSLTTKFSKYPVISSITRQPLNFRLCDTRGLESGNLMTAENLRILLEGHLPDKFPLDPSGSISSDTPGFIKYPNLHDQIHCVAFFIDATQVDTMSDLIPEVLQNLKDLQKVMNTMEIPQLVLLTKVDSVCKHVEEGVSSIFRSPTVEHCVNKVAEILGLPRFTVLPMKNLENEGKLDTNISILTLLNLQTLLENVDAFLFNKRDEIEEKYLVVQKSEY
ncbi:hypothetical protein ACJMK2_040568 [Sinanodonta woodiana]|uniref:Interferon-induced protein 44-like n=1 Tax=Sinanodonta woodiana TaxID=1069815 RepID=A0ABD3W2S4_SINWO